MDLLITLLIYVLIFGLLYWAITLLPLPEPFKQLALVIFVIIVILLLVNVLLGVVPLRVRGP
jgi:hypothetical protein